MSKVIIEGSQIFTVAFEDKGYLRRTGTGQVCIDDCPTDEDHLGAPTPEGFDRRMCRTLLSDLVPDEFLGRKGHIKVTIEFESEDKN